MLSGAQDAHTPAWHAQIVLDGVPDPRRVEHRAVADAGHFSFLSPFPPALVGPALPPSQDPPGFDRQAFHAVLVRDVQRFLQAHLPAGQER
ncbi:MAG TPA: hypothetical protein VHF92_15995 [Geodermatophilus sp.]|nr:hypothetical protein [Geodermatophilus sp.]